MFRWAAPLFARYGDRWSNDDIHQLAELLGPSVPEGGSVLDLGGGTGALAHRIATALQCRVTVLDPTPEMLAHVPDDEAVSTVLGKAESMPLESDSFDAALVSDAFHHFRDQAGAVSEIARVVRPGGGVLVLELDPRGVVVRLIVAAEKLLGEPGAFHTPEMMCAFFAEHGIEGDCVPTRWPNYYFCGTVPG